MRCAVVHWGAEDGVARAIERELESLGVRAESMGAAAEIPEACKTVFSFAPYGRLSPLMGRLAAMAPARRPMWVHWSMECFPSLRLPWPMVSTLARGRSMLDQWQAAREAVEERRPAPGWLAARGSRYRFVGDYLQAMDAGLLTRLVESSDLHVRIYRRQGYDVPYVPWGIPDAWHEDLGLQRDVDVLWMGKRRTGRRSRRLDRLRGELTRRGISMHVADGVEQPFLHGAERIRMLNRARITLNLLPRWYDTAFSFRFVHAAANGSLVISEPNLAHVPEIEPGRHYLVAEPADMADRIEDCLRRPERQAPVIDAARELVRDRLSMRRSLAQILEWTT